MRWPAPLALVAAGSLAGGVGACGPGEEPEDARCAVGEVCVIMGTGELGFNGEGLPALESRLASPTAVHEDPDGRVVVVDFSNMRLRALASDGSLVTMAGNGEHAFSEVGLPATESPMENPVDAGWGADGLLYLQPSHEYRIVRVEADGTIGAYAGLGYLGDAGTGDDAATATMGYGAGLALASDGSLYLSDATFNRVRRVSPDGVLANVLGTGAPGAGAPGYGPEVALHGPERLVLDEDQGRLLVADSLNHRVLALDLDTLEVSLVAGDGTEGSSGDGGDARLARLDLPVGLAIGPDGTVLIADLGGNLIRAVDPDGIIRTVVGHGEAEVDPVPFAEPLEMPLRGPGGLGWTSDGDLLIAERSGHRVLRWDGASDAL